MLDSAYEWATEDYSFIMLSDNVWKAYVRVGGKWVIYYIGSKEDALRIAKKYGNRLRRLNNGET